MLSIGRDKDRTNFKGQCGNLEIISKCWEYKEPKIEKVKNISSAQIWVGSVTGAKWYKSCSLPPILSIDYLNRLRK